MLFLQFYFKNGRPPPNELKEQCLFAIDQHFYGRLGLQIHGKGTLLICGQILCWFYFFLVMLNVIFLAWQSLRQ